MDIAAAPDCPLVKFGMDDQYAPPKTDEDEVPAVNVAPSSEHPLQEVKSSLMAPFVVREQGEVCPVV
jgi:hypothetical protein